MINRLEIITPLILSANELEQTLLALGGGIPATSFGANDVTDTPSFVTASQVAFTKSLRRRLALVDKCLKRDIKDALRLAKKQERAPAPPATSPLATSPASPQSSSVPAVVPETC